MSEGFIDLDECDIGTRDVGLRLRLKGGVLQASINGAAYANVGSAATSAALTGATTTTVVATEAIDAALAVTALGAIADATDDTLPPLGVTVAAVADEGTATLVTHGPAAVLTAATPGALIWLDADAGILTETAPSASGNTLWLMGTAVSATVLYVNISYLGEVP